MNLIIEHYESKYVNWHKVFSNTNIQDERIPFFSRPAWMAVGLCVSQPKNVSIMKFVSNNKVVAQLALEDNGTNLTLLPNSFSDYTDLCMLTEIVDFKEVAIALAGYCREFGRTFSTNTINPEGGMNNVLFHLQKISSTSIVRYRQHYSVNLRAFDINSVSRTLRKQARRAESNGFKMVEFFQPDESFVFSYFFGFYAARWQLDRNSLKNFEAKVKRFFEACRLEDIGVRVFGLTDRTGKLYAIRIGYSENNTYFDFLTAFDLQTPHMSTGSVLLVLLLSNLKKSGYSSLDFMRGEELYKKRLSNECKRGKEAYFEFGGVA